MNLLGKAAAFEIGQPCKSCQTADGDCIEEVGEVLVEDTRQLEDEDLARLA